MKTHLPQNEQSSEMQDSEQMGGLSLMPPVFSLTASPSSPPSSGGNQTNVIQRIGEEKGQSTTGSTRHLICDLTSPITVGSEPRYEMMQHGQELWSSDSTRTFQWKIFDGNGTELFSAISETPEIQLSAGIPGTFTVQVMVLSDGAATGIRLNMHQTVVAEDSQLTTTLARQDTGSAETFRELINDFRAYIIDGANSTGPNGISPRFLASVLFIEVLNRPKSNREEEIDTVSENINSLQQGGSEFFWSPVNRSVGVGQIRLSTAAMLNGTIPWMDQDRTDREAITDQINENFDALDPDQKAAVLETLRWPESGIRTSAELLARLKNRAHRFPNMTREEFAANEHAVGVVGTEYNSGGTDTPEAQAGASGYGSFVWSNMNNPIFITYFN